MANPHARAKAAFLVLRVLAANSGTAGSGVVRALDENLCPARWPVRLTTADRGTKLRVRLAVAGRGSLALAAATAACTSSAWLP